MYQTRKLQRWFDQQLSTSNYEQPGTALCQRLIQEEDASDEKPDGYQQIIKSAQCLITASNNHVPVAQINIQLLILVLVHKKTLSAKSGTVNCGQSRDPCGITSRKRTLRACLKNGGTGYQPVPGGNLPRICLAWWNSSRPVQLRAGNRQARESWVVRSARYTGGLVAGATSATAKQIPCRPKTGGLVARSTHFANTL